MKKIYLGIIFSTFFITSVAKGEAPDCDKMRVNEQNCLACNIYHEARGESFVDRMLVALVTLNRVESSFYPNTFCEVIWEVRPKRIRNHTGKTIKIKWVPMFSWTKDGKHDRIYEPIPWQDAQLVASFIIDSYVDNHIVNVSSKNKNIVDIKCMMWYHKKSVNPKWAKHKILVKQTNEHRYYRSKRC